ncbi:MAG TPA: peptide chain release factor N(5)-glutamine methyltransferase, partial [Cellulomonadaceae bacterium]|nr:peptide chain release factor N(5)-glutamine methyltransferase [Cellulomonadaceae bacterium]
MSETPSLRRALREATATRAAAGVPSPAVDAELLAAFALARESGHPVSRGEVQAAVVLGAGAPAGLADLVAARARRVPLQHLTGIAPFRGLELAVGPGVFIPRPETEQVAQVAIDEARVAITDRGDALVVDLCTGSGA